MMPTPLTSDSVVVRWATPADQRQQLDIERAWRHEKEDFWGATLLTEFLPSRKHLWASLVAEHPIRGVVAHLQFASREKDAVIINLASHPAYCHRGYARRLVSVLTTTLPRRYKRDRLNTVVRAHNLTAHLFFKSCGHKCLGVIDNFYKTPLDDGYHFQYQVPVCQDDPKAAAKPPHKS